MTKTIQMVLAVAALGFVWAQPAAAGRKDISPALIVFVGSEGAASGSLGSTRNDAADPNEYIRCESNVNPLGVINGTAGWWNGSCSARKNGVSVSCTFPKFAQYAYQNVLSTITSDSFVSFSWNPSNNNQCDSLYVYMDSFDDVKVP
jgi:hypothetical protein